MKLLLGLVASAGLSVIIMPIAALADGESARAAPVMEVDPGFPPSDSEDAVPPTPPSTEARAVNAEANDGNGGVEMLPPMDSQDNVPPAQFANAGGRAEVNAGAANDEEPGMPPTDSEDNVPPADAPGGSRYAWSLDTPSLE